MVDDFVCPIETLDPTTGGGARSIRRQGSLRSCFLGNEALRGRFVPPWATYSISVRVTSYFPLGSGGILSTSNHLTWQVCPITARMHVSMRIWSFANA